MIKQAVILAAGMVEHSNHNDQKPKKGFLQLGKNQSLKSQSISSSRTESKKYGLLQVINQDNLKN